MIISLRYNHILSFFLVLYNSDDLYKKLCIIHNHNNHLKAAFWIQIPVDPYSYHQVDRDPYFKYRSGSSEGNCSIKYPTFGLNKVIAFEKCFFYLDPDLDRYESVGIVEKSGSGSGSRYLKTYMDPNNA